MRTILPLLRDRLIVSCQPVPGGPLDKPEIIAALALAALDGGAAGLRIEGIANVKAVRRVSSAPLIGLVKRDLSDSPVRITPYLRDVRELVDAGADIVAFDATERPRPETVPALVHQIRALGAIAMADCSCGEDGQRAIASGADILGSTLSGYTGVSEPDGPDVELVSQLSLLCDFVMAEGRYHIPAQAEQAIHAGASCVVVGSAITRPEHVTDWFAKAVNRACAEARA